jgi:hypothetical protein
MLWLHGQLSPLPTMRDLLLPSLVALVVPLGLLQLTAPEFKGAAQDRSSTTSGGSSDRGQQQEARPDLSLTLSSSGGSLDGGGASISSTSGGGESKEDFLAFEEASKRGPLVLVVGLGALLSVPAFKYLTGNKGDSLT